MFTLIANGEPFGKKWLWYGNEVHVDSRGIFGVLTIATAVARAEANDVIVIHPGTYTETGVAINKVLSFVGYSEFPEDIVWQGTTGLWTATADVNFSNIYFEQLVNDSTQMATIGGAYRTNFTNCQFRFHHFIANRDTSEWNNTQWYPLHPAKLSGSDTLGWFIPRGQVYAYGDFQVGEPLNWDDGYYYGIQVCGGALFHTRCSKANMYCRTDSLLYDTTAAGVINHYPAITIAGSGTQVVFYTNAIISNSAEVDNYTIRVGADAGFVCYGGEIVGQSDTAAVIYLANDSGISLRRVHVKNKFSLWKSNNLYLGPVYDSDGTVTATIEHCWFVGDPPSFNFTTELPVYSGEYAKSFTITSTGDIPGDSIIVVPNIPYDVLLQEIMIVSSSDNDTLYLSQTDSVGANWALIDTVIATYGSGPYYWKYYTSALNNDTLFARNKLWVKEGGTNANSANIEIKGWIISLP